MNKAINNKIITFYMYDTLFAFGYLKDVSDFFIQNRHVDLQACTYINCNFI